jgi:hypothetical protein
MNANTPTSTTVTVIDGFDLAAQDMTASPIRGINTKFVDGEYFSFKDRLDVDERTFVVLDMREGWQFLKKDCPPEYLMRPPGGLRPIQPHVDMAEWPRDLNGKPAHPWKYCRYLYLLDAATGEISTFWTNTTGGERAVRDLQDQVTFMRKMRPGAHPVVQLRSKDMPTQFGSTKPRPHFQIVGWKQADGPVEQAQIAGPTADVVEPTLSEKMGGDEIPWNDSPDIDAPTNTATPEAPQRKPETQAQTTKRGVQKLASNRR